MSTNFLQWNPGEINQEDDAAYVADAQRTGGAPIDSVFPSATANKLFFQLSTMVTMLANFMVAQGFSAQDSNLTTLLTNWTNTIKSVSNRVQSLNTTPVTVNAATNTFQNLMSSSSPFSASSLNTLGKIIRISAHGTYQTAATGTSLTVGFNLGGSFQPVLVQIDEAVGSNKDWFVDLIGVVTTVGSSGTINFYNKFTSCDFGVITPTTFTFPQAGSSNFSITANLNNPLTPQLGIKFSSFTTSNIGVQDLLLVEQLN